MYIFLYLYTYAELFYLGDQYGLKIARSLIHTKRLATSYTNRRTFPLQWFPVVFLSHGNLQAEFLIGVQLTGRNFRTNFVIEFFRIGPEVHVHLKLTQVVLNILLSKLWRFCKCTCILLKKRIDFIKDNEI